MSKQCKFIKSNGNRCKLFAKKGFEYCATHLRKMQKEPSAVSHGQYANKGRLGIPESHELTYQQFIAREKPLDLSDEIATLRTLYNEFRDRLKKYSLDTRLEAAQNLKKLIYDFFDYEDADPDEINRYTEQLYEIIWELFEKYIPLYQLDQKSIYTLKDLIGEIGKNCERMKKIQDGFVLKVEIKAEYFHLFYQQVLAKRIKDPVLLRQISEDCLSFTRRYIKTEQHLLDVPLEESENEYSKPIGEVLQDAYI